MSHLCDPKRSGGKVPLTAPRVVTLTMVPKATRLVIKRKKRAAIFHFLNAMDRGLEGALSK
jgi:hypothetical protein